MRITLQVAGEEYKLRCDLSEERAQAIEEKVQSQINSAAGRGLSTVQLLILVSLNLAQELEELEQEYEQVLEFVTAREQS